MSPQNSDSVDDLLAEVVERRMAGEDPDSAMGPILAAHPDKADELRARLADLEKLSRLWRQALPTAGPGSGKPAAPSVEPGTCLGEFRIARELGQGGMGVVYVARQESLNRTVALKVIAQGAALSERTRERFVREAEAMAALSHPNIVPVFAAGQSGGALYIAMEYVDGVSLAGVLDGVRRRLPTRQASESWQAVVFDRPDEPAKVPFGPVEVAPPVPALDRAYIEACCRTITDIAEALHFAHERGIIHRDVKPANILIDREGRARLVDFGLAAVNTQPHVTISGEFFGTPHYVSPEQARGRHDQIDRRTDVYSLGATLYECLTLRPPFDGRSIPEVLAQVMHAEPRPARMRNRSVPKDLDTIVTKTLAKDPSDRYASAKELAEDIERYLAAEPILARRTSLPVRLARRVRRRPLVTVFAVLAAALAMALALALRARRSVGPGVPPALRPPSPRAVAPRTLLYTPPNRCYTLPVPKGWHVSNRRCLLYKLDFRSPDGLWVLTCYDGQIHASAERQRAMRAAALRIAKQRYRRAEPVSRKVGNAEGHMFRRKRPSGTYVWEIYLGRGKRSCELEIGYNLVSESPLPPFPSALREALEQLNLGDPKAASREHTGWPPAGHIVSAPAGLDVIYLPPGRFVMGSPGSEPGRRDNEARHPVQIPKGFYIGKTEVTWDQWKVVMKDTAPMDRLRQEEGIDWAKCTADNAPVTMVTWEEAAAFCQALSKRVRRRVRLPTEAEWEYACRAGSTTSYCFGDDPRKLGEYATLPARGSSMPAKVSFLPVGWHKANAWGLYDMHGNVREWCADLYAPYPSPKPSRTDKMYSRRMRVVRGGSVRDRSPAYCRSALRRAQDPQSRSVTVGFRVAMECGRGP